MRKTAMLAHEEDRGLDRGASTGSGTGGWILGRL